MKSLKNSKKFKLHSKKTKKVKKVKNINNVKKRKQTMKGGHLFSPWGYKNGVKYRFLVPNVVSERLATKTERGVTKAANNYRRKLVANAMIKQEAKQLGHVVENSGSSISTFQRGVAGFGFGGA
jgi:hypothetical protein